MIGDVTSVQRIRPVEMCPYLQQTATFCGLRQEQKECFLILHFGTALLTVVTRFRISSLQALREAFWNIKDPLPNLLCVWPSVLGPPC